MRLGFQLPASAVLIYTLVFGLPSLPETGRRVWVLQPPGRMVEYSTSGWAEINRVKVPSEFLTDPGYLQINRKGQILFCADPCVQYGNPSEHFSAGKAWFWNGAMVMLLPGSPAGKNIFGLMEHSAEEKFQTWVLSSSGLYLYRIERESRIRKNREGADLSISSGYSVWQTDLNGDQPRLMASHSFPPCECGTGACSETCPEAAFWFPEEGLDDFLIATHWIPGQIGATYQSSLAFTKSDGKWDSTVLPQTLEQVHDATQGGNWIIYSLPDGGCCGWENESNDQTKLTRNGRSIILYDERKHFSNPDYDISFYVSKARISPDRLRIALTLSSTAQSGGEIGLSDSGKDNPTELKRIREGLSTMPAVEILGGPDFADRLAVIPHAKFAGWLGPQELLVVVNDSLELFNAASGTGRKLPIKASSDLSVFVR
jgi:hypothetical protein